MIRAITGLATVIALIIFRLADYNKVVENNNRADNGYTNYHFTMCLVVFYKKKSREITVFVYGYFP